MGLWSKLRRSGVNNPEREQQYRREQPSLRKAAYTRTGLIGERLLTDPIHTHTNTHHFYNQLCLFLSGSLYTLWSFWPQRSLHPQQTRGRNLPVCSLWGVWKIYGLLLILSHFIGWILEFRWIRWSHINNISKQGDVSSGKKRNCVQVNVNRGRVLRYFPLLSKINHTHSTGSDVAVRQQLCVWKPINQP